MGPILATSVASLASPMHATLNAGFAAAVTSARAAPA